MLCLIREFLESGTTDECEMDDFLEEGRCVGQVSDVEMELFQVRILCDIVGLLTDSVTPGGLCSPYMTRKYGSGSPENVVIGCKGDLYTDVDTGAKYSFVGVNGTSVGWV